MRLSIRLSLKGQMASYWIAGAANSGMGSAAIVGAASVANFKHVILNNGVHDSVGGMATAGLRVSFTEIARACGYTERGALSGARIWPRR